MTNLESDMTVPTYGGEVKPATGATLFALGSWLRRGKASADARQLFLEGALEDLEVQQQLHIFGEFVALHRQFHGEIVAVQTFALAFVMAQGMACGNLVTHRKAPDLLGHILSFGWSGPARVHS